MLSLSIFLSFYIMLSCYCTLTYKISLRLTDSSTFRGQLIRFYWSFRYIFIQPWLWPYNIKQMFNSVIFEKAQIVLGPGTQDPQVVIWVGQPAQSSSRVQHKKCSPLAHLAVGSLVLCKTAAYLQVKCWMTFEWHLFVYSKLPLQNTH